MHPHTDQKGFFHESAIGSTLLVTDPAQTASSRYEYDAYGVQYTLAESLTTPYRFGGKHGYYLDADSGMLLLGHRYYLPVLGRFLTQDPKGHDAGLNLYEYADNNPLSNVDPDGTGPAGIAIRLVSRLIPGRAMHIGRNLTTREAQEIRRKGGNVIVSGLGAKRVAKQIEDAVPGKTYHEGPHPGNPQGRPHFQSERPGPAGHTFYEPNVPVPPAAFLAIPLADLGDRAGGGIPGFFIDLLNPLGDVQALVDLFINLPIAITPKGVKYDPPPIPGDQGVHKGKYGETIYH